MMHHLEHPGHIKLIDGSVVRLDRELGSYVATWYRSDLSVRFTRRGQKEEMTAVIDAWVVGFYEAFGGVA